MIFPGMDPYLEDPQIWPGVHNPFIVYLADQLQPLLRPRYIAAIEERVYLEAADSQIVPHILVEAKLTQSARSRINRADIDESDEVQVSELEVHEAYVAILDLQSGQKVVTVIEVVSPANKFPGPGRTSYKAKQKEVRQSETHLVEIDLLRTGPHVLAVAEWAARGRGPYDYLVCVNRAQGLRDKYELFMRRLPERLPRVPVPLAGEDPDVRLDLQAVLDQVYEAGSYRDRINYDAPCVPPLSPGDQAWANERIKAAQTRA